MESLRATVVRSKSLLESLIDALDGTGNGSISDDQARV